MDHKPKFFFTSEDLLTDRIKMSLWKSFGQSQIDMQNKRFPIMKVQQFNFENAITDRITTSSLVKAKDGDSVKVVSHDTVSVTSLWTLYTVIRAFILTCAFVTEDTAYFDFQQAWYAIGKIGGYIHLHWNYSTDSITNRIRAWDQTMQAWHNAIECDHKTLKEAIKDNASWSHFWTSSGHSDESVPNKGKGYGKSKGRGKSKAKSRGKKGRSKGKSNLTKSQAANSRSDNERRMQSQLDILNNRFSQQQNPSKGPGKGKGKEGKGKKSGKVYSK
jgi:hypothetical protein